MKYAITIIASTAIFTILGLLGAWLAAAYQSPSESGGDPPSLIGVDVMHGNLKNESLLKP